MMKRVKVKSPVIQFNRVIERDPAFLSFLEKYWKIQSNGYFYDNDRDKEYFGKFFHIFQNQSVRKINNEFEEPYQNILIELNEELDDIIKGLKL